MSNPKNISQNRGNLRRSLAIQWIKSKRPDVEAVINAAVNKQFPLPPKSSRVTLTPELEKIEK